MTDLDLSDLKIDINTTSPLGSLNINEKRLFELASADSFVYTNEGVVAFTDSDNLDIIKEGDLANILKINAVQSFFITHNISPGGFFLAPTITIPVNESFEFELEYESGSSGVVIDELTILAGSLNAINNSQGVDISGIKFTIPVITKDGVPITINGNDEPLSLEGCLFEPTFTDNVNKILIKVEGDIIIKGDITNSASINYGINITDLKAGSITGKFGRQTLSTQTQEISIAGNTTDFFQYIDDFAIADPSISIDINSEANIPTLVIIEQMKINGDIMELKKEYNKDRFLIKEGGSKIVINNDTFENGSALTDAITKNFKSVTVTFLTIINPNNDDLLSDDIIEPTTNSFNVDDLITGVLNYQLPIAGYFKGIKIEESFDMNLDIESDDDYSINSLSLAIYAENSFPIDINLSLYTEDEGGVVTPLSDEYVTIPSSVNNINPDKGEVIPGIVDANNVNIMTIDKAASDRLFSAKKLMFKINASSTKIEDKQIIYFYKDSNLNLNLVVGVEGEIFITNSTNNPN